MIRQASILNKALFGYAFYRIIPEDNGNPADFQFVDANESFELITGMNKRAILGKTFTEINQVKGLDAFGLINLLRDVPVDQTDTIVKFDEVSGKHYRIQVYSPEKDCFVALLTDVSKQQHADGCHEITREILQVLNDSGDFHACIEHVIATLKTRIGVDAVGLRLQDDEDFPYLVQDGFSPSFLMTENTILARGNDGSLCRDEYGHVRFECMCGLVISGKTDTFNSFFTPAGSFWTNDSRVLLDLPSSLNPCIHARNNCIEQGYTCMALIPVRNSERIVGLIQLNDKRKDRFTLEMIESLEGVAASIGTALGRKQLEAELMQSREALRKLLGKIEDTREAERTRIARDMHDDLGQNLTALKMDVRWIELAMETSCTTLDVGEIRARARAAIEMADAMVNTVHELASSLRPSVLDSLGLAAAIRSEVRRFQLRFGIDCRTSLSETLPDIPMSVTVAIFRIFQECLTNIARHAAATRINIRIGGKDGYIVLFVHDNGKGIPSRAIDDPSSLGLLGMKERISGVGGEIRFRAGRKHGTLVVVRIPNQETLAAAGES